MFMYMYMYMYNMKSVWNKSFIRCSPDEPQSIISRSSPDESQSIIYRCSPDESQSIISRCSPDQSQNIISRCSPDELQRIISRCSPDELQNIISRCSPDQPQSIISGCSPDQPQSIIYRCSTKLNITDQLRESIHTIDSRLLITYRPRLRWSMVQIPMDDMHVVWFSMWDGFFSPRVASDSGGIRRRVVRNPSHMENHTKYIFSHTYTLRHFNQAKYTVQSCRPWKPCEMDLSRCSLHEGRSEVCEK